MELEKRKAELLMLMGQYEIEKMILIEKANKMRLFGDGWENGIEQWFKWFNTYCEMVENSSVSETNDQEEDFITLVEQAGAFKDETTKFDWEITTYYKKAKRITDVFKGMNAEEKKISGEKLKEMRFALSSGFPRIMKDADSLLEKCEAYQNRFHALAEQVAAMKMKAAA